MLFDDIEKLHGALNALGILRCSEELAEPVNAEGLRIKVLMVEYGFSISIDGPKQATIFLIPKSRVEGIECPDGCIEIFLFVIEQVGVRERPYNA